MVGSLQGSSSAQGAAGAGLRLSAVRSLPPAEVGLLPLLCCSHPKGKQPLFLGLVTEGWQPISRGVICVRVQPRAGMASCATHSSVPLFNVCFSQGFIWGRVEALIAWQLASLLVSCFSIFHNRGERRESIVRHWRQCMLWSSRLWVLHTRDGRTGNISVSGG